MTQRPEPLACGELPRDARERLQAAAKVGRPGTITRASAIDRAYRYIEDTYPQFLRKDYGGTDA